MLWSNPLALREKTYFNTVKNIKTILPHRSQTIRSSSRHVKSSESKSLDITQPNQLESELLIAVNCWRNNQTTTSWTTNYLLESITAPSNMWKHNDGKHGQRWCEGIPTAFTHGWILVWGSFHTSERKKALKGIRGGVSRSAQLQRNNHSWGEIFTMDSLRMASFTQDLLCMKVKSSGAAPRHRKHYFMSIKSKRNGGFALIGI